MSYTQEECFT